MIGKDEEDEDAEGCTRWVKALEVLEEEGEKDEGMAAEDDDEDVVRPRDRRLRTRKERKGVARPKSKGPAKKKQVVKFKNLVFGELKTSKPFPSRHIPTFRLHNSFAVVAAAAVLEWLIQPPNLAEDSGALSPTSRALFSKVGTIEVALYQMKEYKSRKSARPRFEAKVGIDNVPEKSLKGKEVAHSIRFAKGNLEGEEAPKEEKVDSRVIHGWEHPIGVFRFRYRSRGAYSAVFTEPLSPPFPVKIRIRRLYTNETRKDERERQERRE